MATRREGLVFYRLGHRPPESASEAEDWDEWFTSLAAAEKRRRALIAEDPDLDNHSTGRDFEIDRVALSDLPHKELALALLNRAEPFQSKVRVVDYYDPRALLKKGRSDGR